jgi:hypothetical protein
MSVRLAVGIAALLVLSGCVTSRSEVAVNFVPPANVQANASNGKKVLISTVDERVFQVSPRNPATPSLKNDEVTDKSITERAIARKRNGYGMALGDVLLPSGRTLAQLVNESVASAYQQAGYEVVTEPSAADTKVKVHIVEFWSWFTPGFFMVDVSSKSLVRIEMPGAKTFDVVTLQNQSMQVVMEKDWKKITEQNLQEVSQQTARHL